VSRERIGRQLKELWSYVEEVYQDEEQQPNTPDIEKIDPEAVEQTIREINEALREKEIDPKVKQKLHYARKNWPGKLREDEQKEKLLAGRKSRTSMLYRTDALRASERKLCGILPAC